MKSSARYGEDRINDSSDEGSSYQVTDPITLAIWGDPVVAHALALLLGSYGYDARILSGSSLNTLKAVKGVKLLLLTPTPALRSKDRKAFLASISDVLETTKTPVLELATPSEQTREGKTRGGLWYMVAWPCRIQKLQQWIEAALTEEASSGPAERHPSPSSAQYFP